MADATPAEETKQARAATALSLAGLRPTALGPMTNQPSPPRERSTRLVCGLL